MNRFLSLCLCAVLLSLVTCASAYMTCKPATGYITQTDVEHGYNALDVANNTGTRIDTCHRGNATRRSDPGGYGTYITMAHHDNYVSYYCHLSAYVAVNGGEYWVGDQIGKMGSTGNSTGPHMHFEMRHNGVRLHVPGVHNTNVTRGTDLHDWPGI